MGKYKEWEKYDRYKDEIEAIIAVVKSLKSDGVFLTKWSANTPPIEVSYDYLKEKACAHFGIDYNRLQEEKCQCIKESQDKFTHPTN